MEMLEPSIFPQISFGYFLKKKLRGRGRAGAFFPLFSFFLLFSSFLAVILVK